MSLSKMTQDATTPEVERAEDSRELAVLGESGGGGALAALAATADSATIEVPYPLVYLAGGTSGGSINPAPFLPQDVQDRLPQGKKPIHCVYVSYRLEAVLWAEKYDEDAEEKQQPVWNLAVPYSDITNYQKLMAAARAYNFTPGVDKEAKFSVSHGGPGHLRPQLSVLVYVPDLDSLLIVRSCAVYGSVSATADSLLAVPAKLKRMMGDEFPDLKGGLPPFPCALRPTSKETTSRRSGSRWVTHSLTFEPSREGECLKAWEQWPIHKAGIKADPESLDSFRSWLDGADHPISDDKIAVLDDVIARGPTR